jgi:uncharacterized protein (TIGR03032 family)
MNKKNLGYNSPIDQEFRYIHTSNLPDLLEELGISLFISTYQAGKLMVVRAHQGKLITLLRTFQQVMGIAVTSQHLAVGTLNQIWSFDNVPQVASQLEPINHYDACFVPRLSHVTGNIQVHELAWIQKELWIVNTRFSCLCTLAAHSSFVPRWQPHFITALTAEDRCHLNGLALVDNQPRYVTALGTTNTPQGWRSHKTIGGCVIDIPSNEMISNGLCMPHSPRWYQEKLWLLDSGTGRLMVIDPNSGKAEMIAEIPGFARGLAFYEKLCFYRIIPDSRKTNLWWITH